MHYYAIDFETANEKRNSACALGIVEIDNHKLINKWDYLINPEDEFNPFYTLLHGIKSEDIIDKPTFADIWPEINSILEGNLVVAHNASFDMSVLRNTLDKYKIPYPNIDYTCTRILSKKTWPSLINYKLNTICSHLEIEFKHHEAYEDALACAKIFEKILEITNTNDIKELCNNLNVNIGSIYKSGYNPACVKKTSSYIKPTSITPETNKFDESNEFYGKTICFTGTLSSMERKYAAQLVVNKGGTFGNTITKKTNYLVLGIQDYSRFADGQKSSKLKKAEELISKGQDLEIISEDEFLNLL